MEALHTKFTDRSATICVIGQGYVGLPLALHFVEAGFRVIGLDTDKERVARLVEGRSYVTDVADARLGRALDTGRFEPTADYARTGAADAVCICVPTPLSKTRQPDLSYIHDALDMLAEHLRPPCLVVLESTTFPGTTEEIVWPRLTKDSSQRAFERGEDRGGGSLSTKRQRSGEGLRERPPPVSSSTSPSASRRRTPHLDPPLPSAIAPGGEGVFVAFSPERVDPANPHYNITNTPKVVGGVDEASTRLVTALYEQIIDEVHPVKSATEAETVKLLENTFRAVNIALVNEMAVMCDRMGIDIWEVIEAASTKPFGFMPFYPGPGIGGHCIPLDPSYLSWKAKSFGFHNRFIELASDLNTNMPRFVVDKLVRLLNDHGKAANGANILLLGVAYKPNVHDTRESPAIDIWRLLQDWGAQLSYHDPHVPHVTELDATSKPLTPELVAGADAVVVVTDHDGVDYAMVAREAQLVLDTRCVMEPGDGVVRL